MSRRLKYFSTMVNCCLCSAEFRKRKNFKGYEKRLLSTVLPRKDVTLYEVLQMVCNYKVKVLLLQPFLAV